MNYFNWHLKTTSTQLHSKLAAVENGKFYSIDLDAINVSTSEFSNVSFNWNICMQRSTGFMTPATALGVLLRHYVFTCIFLSVLGDWWAILNHGAAGRGEGLRVGSPRSPAVLLLLRFQCQERSIQSRGCKISAVFGEFRELRTPGYTNLP